MARKAEEISGPDLDHLHDDLEEVRKYADDVSSASGSLREHRKHLVEARGYNKKALGFLYQIWKLPDEKFQDFMRTFGPALEQIKDARAQHGTPDMLDDGNETDYSTPDSDFGDDHTEHDPDADEEDSPEHIRAVG